MTELQKGDILYRKGLNNNLLFTSVLDCKGNKCTLNDGHVVINKLQNTIYDPHYEPEYSEIKYYLYTDKDYVIKSNIIDKKEVIYLDSDDIEITDLMQDLFNLLKCGHKYVKYNIKKVGDGNCEDGSDEYSWQQVTLETFN